MSFILLGIAFISSAKSSSTPFELIPAVISTATYPLPTPLVPPPTTPTIPSASLSKKELGPCICDLTEAICDADCLCDPVCTAEDISLFSNHSPEGPLNPILPKCVDPLIVSVHRRGDLLTNIAGSLFCVTKVNNPSKGFFLDTPHPDNFTPFILTSMKNAAQPQIDANLALPQPFTTFPPAASSSSSISSYRSGDKIRLAVRTPWIGTTYTLSHPSTTFLFEKGSSFNYLPNPAATPLCNSEPLQFFFSRSRASDILTQKVGTSQSYDPRAEGILGTHRRESNYLDHPPVTGTPLSHCTKSIPDLQSACSVHGSISAVLFTAHSVARTPSATFSDPTSWRKIIIERVSRYDESTATYNSIYDLQNDPAIIADPTLDPVLIDYSFPVPTFATTGSTCTCTDAVLGASLRLQYNSAGAITDVFASVVLGSVAGINIGSTCSAVYTQDWAVTYVRDDADPLLVKTEILPSGLTVARVRSGNPGYLQGRPVLAGTVTAGVVAETLSGLSFLPTSISTSTNGYNARVCQPWPGTPSAAGGISRNLRTTQIRFGEDSVITCSLELTLSEFQTACTSVQAFQDYLQLSSQMKSLGRWGNSSATNPTDWINIEEAVWPAVGGGYLPETTTCRGMVSSMMVEIYTADYGAVTNPQRAIVASKVRYISSDVSFRMTDFITESGYIVLSASVSFFLYPNRGVIEYVPTGPPAVIRLPEDFLYPFYVPSGSGAFSEKFKSWRMCFIFVCIFIIFDLFI